MRIQDKKGWSERSTAAFIFLLLSAVAASAATFTVTNTNDSGPGSLRQAIIDANAAAGDDTIVFDAGVFSTPQTIVLTSGELTIQDSNLTINGPGSGLLSISGNNQSRSFIIRATGAPVVTATFNNLTIKDGIGGGGAIRGNGPLYQKVTLNASWAVLRDKFGSPSFGGAIQVAHGVGDLNIDNSIFYRNTGNGGGAIGCGGGGSSCASVTITDTLFEENNSGSNGGAFTCCGNGAQTTPITLERVAFIRNVSGNNGTALRLSADVNTNFNLRNVTIAGNTTTPQGIGPAVVFQFGKLNFENSTIAYNTNRDTSTDRAAGLASTWPEMIVTFRNTIVAKNTNANGVALDIDIRNRILNSQGYNIFGTLIGGTVVEGDTTGNQIGVDPLLDAIPRRNGSFLKTLALRPGSPAIDAADPANFLATDQRGIARPVDGDGNGTALPDIGAFERRPEDFVPIRPAFDFDGDARTDVSIFRPAEDPSQWWLLRSSDLGVRGYQFGTQTDVPVPADLTGDGRADLVFWRPSTGLWYVLRSEDSSFYAFPFGAQGDIPAPGDFDGDGVSDPAVFRPGIGTWFIRNSSNGVVSTVPFGTADDKPIVADYDGDGRDDIAVYRSPSRQFWLLRSSLGVKAFQFSDSGDRTAIGDWTGDGHADVAFFRPSRGEWFVLRSEDDSFFAFPWGTSGDIPAPGDYDGDGRTDAAIYRPSDRTWYILGSANGFEAYQFGADGDLPLPATVSIQ